MPAVKGKKETRKEVEVKKIKHDSKKSKTKICGQKKVKEAVHALKLLNKKFVEEDLKKQPLLEDTTESPIYLQVMLKKIPPPQLMRMIRVPLPHSLITETSEVCLITGDLDKRDHKAEIEPTILHYKDLLRKHDVTKVAQIIPLRQLRTEYKTFESKRQLAAAYDVFLADKKIAGVLPKTLGKPFFKDRKFPIPIDMRKQNLKDQIDKALCQTEFSLTCRGNSYSFEIARLSMEDNAIMENIKSSMEVLANRLPGKENNILSLYLKTAKSKAIPIYVSLDISTDILIKKPRRNEKFKLDELSTMDDAEVKVFRDGRVVLRKLKKESSSLENSIDDHENVDSNEPLSFNVEDEDTIESIANEVSLKKKKKSKKISDLIEITTNDQLKNANDPEDSIVNKSSVKKKRKSKIAELEEVTNNAELVIGNDTEDSIVNKSSVKKKRKSKIAKLEEVTNNAEFVIEDDTENFIANEVPKKNKKGKKSICVDQVATSSDVGNEEIQESITTEVSPKKKKKGRKDMAVLDNTEIVTKEVFQTPSSVKASSKAKNKKDINSSHFEVNEALEKTRESSIILSSRKRKIHEDMSENVQKSKSKKLTESQDNGEIERNMKSKMRKSILEKAEENINVKATPKSKKEKNTVEVETSVKKVVPQRMSLRSRNAKK